MQCRQSHGTISDYSLDSSAFSNGCKVSNGYKVKEFFSFRVSWHVQLRSDGRVANSRHSFFGMMPLHAVA